jgi:hypothetical protein
MTNASRPGGAWSAVSASASRVAELSRPLMADGTLRSQLASHVAIARR